MSIHPPSSESPVATSREGAANFVEREPTRLLSGSTTSSFCAPLAPHAQLTNIGPQVDGPPRDALQGHVSSDQFDRTVPVQIRGHDAGVRTAIVLQHMGLETSRELLFEPRQ